MMCEQGKSSERRAATRLQGPELFGGASMGHDQQPASSTGAAKNPEASSTSQSGPLEPDGHGEPGSGVLLLVAPPPLSPGNHPPIHQ